MNIVITGGTRGIGRGLVEYFISKGHNVTYTGTNEKTLISSYEDLEKNYHEVLCDVRNPEDIEHLYYEAVNRFGRVDVWFNNAGVNQERGNISEISYEEIDRVVDINIKGSLYASHYVLKKMHEEDHGILYNMEGLGSDGRKIPGTLLYGGSKRLIRYITKGMEKEVRGNVRVGRISPGMVRTDLLLEDIQPDAKRIVDILSDEVEIVTNYIGKQIESGKQNIFWLTNRKVLWKFTRSLFKKSTN